MSRLPRAGSETRNVTFRITEDERSAWQRAADSSGARTLSDWARDQLNRAARRAERSRR